MAGLGIVHPDGQQFMVSADVLGHVSRFFRNVFDTSSSALQLQLPESFSFTAEDLSRLLRLVSTKNRLILSYMLSATCITHVK